MHRSFIIVGESCDERLWRAETVQDMQKYFIKIRRMSVWQFLKEQALRL